MDDSFGQILNAYYSVTLNTEITGIFCIYYLIVNHFQKILLFFTRFEEVPEDDEEDNRHEEEHDSDEDFIFDLEHFSR